MRALVARGDSPAKSMQASVAARKVAESRDLTVRVFARRWIDFVEALLQPPAPSARLKRAAQAYRSTGA